MRILLATDAFFPKIDGVAETSGMIARILARRGHEVTIIAPGPGGDEHEGARVVRLRSVPLPFYKDVRVSVNHGLLAATVRAFQPDATIILTPGTIGFGVAKALPAMARRIVIYTTDMPRYLRAYSLGALNRPVDRMMRWMSDGAAATLCPTAVVHTELARRSFPRLEVWGRGVDHDLFNPERRSSQMRFRLSGGEPHKPLVLYVGRLAREKRLGDLYDAATQVSGMRFALVGDGPDRDSLQRQFANVPVVFTGFLRGAPLAEAYASADMFAFPSDSETFGQVVLQAMASGVPPLVVRDTAPAEFVQDGVTGVHVPARDAAGLAEALTRLGTDSRGRAVMSTNAATAAKSHSWDTLVTRLECLLAGEEARRIA